MADEQYFEPYIIDSATIKKMQGKMLEILLCFKEFCEKYDLSWWLIGGGAIGAIREHGFVPWDDDVDVQMPRPDYERFHELWELYGDKERYVLCRTNANVNYHHAASSLRDPNTTFICSYNQHSNIVHGLSLEIGPMDATTESKIGQYKQIFDGYAFALFNAQRLPNNRGKAMRALTKVAYALVPSTKVRTWIWQKAEKGKMKYDWDSCVHVKELWGKTSFYNFPKEWFDHVVYFDFEGHQMPVMAGYDEYLSLIFGDYMKRPPEEDQVAKHDLVFVDPDNSYMDYKGIYWFADETECES